MGMIIDTPDPNPMGAEARRESFYLHGPGFSYIGPEPASPLDAGRFSIEIEYDHLADLEEAIACLRKYLTKDGHPVPPSHEERAAAVRMDHTALHFTGSEDR